MQSEIRISPDGRNVAIRNLQEVNPKHYGEWRVTNGAYFTDEQVADWVSLNRPHDIHLVKVGEYEDAQTVAAFADKAEAEKYIADRAQFGGGQVDIGETTVLYPRAYLRS